MFMKHTGITDGLGRTVIVEEAQSTFDAIYAPRGWVTATQTEADAYFGAPEPDDTLVTTAQLQAALAGFTPSGGSSVAFADRGAWATGTAYAVGDTFTQSNVRYLTKTAHTSGTFSTDLAAAKMIAVGIVADAVTSVAGRTGTVTLAQSDVAGLYPSSLPAGLTLAYGYNGQANIYNVTPQAYPNTIKAIMAALAGTGGFRVGWYGHSYVYPSGGSGASAAATTSEVPRLRTLLQTKLGDAGDGVIPLNGSISGGGAYGPNGLGGFYSVAAISKTYTADRFRVWFAKDGGAGTVTPSIDGSAQSTVTLTASSAWFPQDYTFTQGSHTITFAQTGLVTQGGLEVRRNGGVGAQVWGAGVVGEVISSVAANARVTDSLQSLGVVGSPSLVIIQCLINDFKNSTSLSSYLTSLNAIVAAVKAAGSDVLLIVDATMSNSIQTGTAIAFNQYVQQVYACADANNVGLIDLSAKWGSNATAVANSLLSGDTIHPGDTGYLNVATTVYYALQSLGVGL